MPAQQSFRKNVKYVIARRFIAEPIAALYAAKLKSEGVACFISNSNTGTLIPFANGGIILHVPEHEYDDAMEIIRELDSNANRRQEEDFRDADLEDIEYEAAITAYENRLNSGSGRTIAWLFILITLALGAYFAVIRATTAANTTQGVKIAPIDGSSVKTPATLAPFLAINRPPE